MYLTTLTKDARTRLPPAAARTWFVVSRGGHLHIFFSAFRKKLSWVLTQERAELFVFLFYRFSRFFAVQIQRQDRHQLVSVRSVYAKELSMRSERQSMLQISGIFGLANGGDT
jgi:hypothetical protein